MMADLANGTGVIPKRDKVATEFLTRLAIAYKAARARGEEPSVDELCRLNEPAKRGRPAGEHDERDRDTRTYVVTCFPGQRPSWRLAGELAARVAATGEHAALDAIQAKYGPLPRSRAQLFTIIAKSSGK